jgi:Ca2+:H+ antiporter
MPAWALVLPLGAAGLLAASLGLPMGAALAAACVLALVGAVIAAVHHAEVVAHRVGEPFGTLVLAVAITVIEVALIVSMMLAGGPDAAARHHLRGGDDHLHRRGRHLPAGRRHQPP